jgi:hypothetical protein
MKEKEELDEAQLRATLAMSQPNEMFERRDIDRDAIREHVQEAGEGIEENHAQIAGPMPEDDPQQWMIELAATAYGMGISVGMELVDPSPEEDLPSPADMMKSVLEQMGDKLPKPGDKWGWE